MAFSKLVKLGALTMSLPVGVSMTSPGNCNYAFGTDKQPFVFYDRSYGNRTYVQPQRDTASGLCVFPEAASTCMHNDEPCCEMSPWVGLRSGTGTLISNLACTTALKVTLLLLWCYHRRRRQQDSAGNTDSSAENDASDYDKQKRSCLWNVLVGIALFTAVAAEIAMQVIKASMTQQMLSVTMKNALVTSDAFIVPIREVFQFLSDVVLVKVKLAMAAGALKEVRRALRLGTIGGLVLGTLAALVMTGIAYWPSVIEFLVAPYTLHEATWNCPLVPTATVVVEETRVYVLLRVWKWPFEFMNIALGGFLLGAAEWWSLALLMLVEQVLGMILFLAWFIKVPTLETLGWIHFISSVFATAFMFGALCLNKPLREKYGLSKVTAQSDSSEQKDTLEPSEENSRSSSEAAEMKANSMKESFIHGLCAMALDVSVQLSLTVGVYIAGSTLGMGALYQISSLQAAFMIYGVQFILFPALGFKIKGTEYIAKREYKEYHDHFQQMMYVASALAVTCVVTLLPFRESVSFQLAEQACEYASEPSCVALYASVFGGSATDTSTTLQGSAFIAFLPAMFAVCYYRLFKSGLYVSQDWAFMAKAGVLTFLAVFVPAILVAVLAIPNTTAIFVASHLPFLVLGLVFAWRTHRNIQKMLNGEPGPWSDVPGGAPADSQRAARNASSATDGPSQNPSTQPATSAETRPDTFPEAQPGAQPVF